MAFKLTYTDGQESDYDDDTKWEVDDGVLKMGREHGKWTVFVSPSHWATIEVAQRKARDGDEDGDKEDDKDDEKDEKDKDENKEDKDKDKNEDKDKDD
ncbi:hypothetical protein [Mycobacterium sp. MMS18-G62]